MGDVVRRVAAVDADAFESLWTAVNKADGAVGFHPDSPQDEVRAAVEDTLAGVRSGRDRLVVLEVDGLLGGTVVLRPGVGERFGHRGSVLRLMVHPDLQGRGHGAGLLAEAVRWGRELGLRQLLLSARGGTTLPAFYVRNGWTQVGVFPAALRLREDDFRDEHWFQYRLDQAGNHPDG